MKTRLLLPQPTSLRVAILIAALAALPADAGESGSIPCVLPAGELPEDVRLGELKDLDGYFPFQPADSVERWRPRAERVRRQLQVSLGLWPWPTRTPLNAVVHGRIEGDGYTIAKVYFESLPGFFVTGNLYRPARLDGKVPGVLCPHGHWSEGRFHDAGRDAVRREIVQGAERFEEGGRSPLQSRCVQLARMGCVVFHYDMIGYADSVQISQAIAHGFSKQRPEMNAPDHWGLFSPQAESHFQSVMGLQTWNSIRSLDFLLSLPEIDPERIAVTGASGGGTQTFILCALDPRPTLAFPAVMVSTAMQGGCTCENACGLRINTGNVEFAALFAPKPLGLTSANDWTREMATKGFPELKQHYTLLGAPDQVMLHRGEHFGHNYNYVSRAAMYAFVNRHFHLGLPEPIVEEDYRRLTRKELSVWDEDHPAPTGGPDFERQLLDWSRQDARQQLVQLRQSPAELDRMLRGGIHIVIGRDLEETGEVRWEPSVAAQREGYRETPGLIRNVSHGEELPAVLLEPDMKVCRVAIWAHPAGKRGLYQTAENGTVSLAAEVRQLLENQVAVLGVDLLYQGEFLRDGHSLEQTRRVQNPREAAAYTIGYNPSLFAQRVHDLLTTVRAAQALGTAPVPVDLIGFEGAGHWVTAARALAGPAVAAAVIDTAGFRFGEIRDLRHPDFLPGGAKYFDLPGMLALAAPADLCLLGESGTALAWVREAYAAAQAPDRLAAAAAEAPATRAAAVRWLLRMKEE